MKTRTFLLLLPFILFMSSCMDDSDWYRMNLLEETKDSLFRESIRKQSGLFIVNEGNFMYDNASLSYYMIDSMKILNEVFYRSNGVRLGDVAQSMVIRDSLGYAVINNSSKIYVFNIHTFEFRGKITGLSSPRFMHFIDDHKAYVTDLYAGEIVIVDPLEMKITGTINTRNPASEFLQHSTEQMVAFGDKVFVNCWSYDNKILVIDSRTDLVTDSIEVPLQPNSIVLDRNGKLWVLCDGGYEGSPFGHVQPALLRIDAATMEIERNIAFSFDDHPTRLTINGSGDRIFFLNGDVFQLDVNSIDTPESVVPTPYENKFSGGYYGLAIDPGTGEIYVGDAVDQVHEGRVYRFTPDGNPVDTFSVGIAPGAFCFKPAG